VNVVENADVVDVVEDFDVNFVADAGCEFAALVPEYASCPALKNLAVINGNVVKTAYSFGDYSCDKNASLIAEKLNCLASH